MANHGPDETVPEPSTGSEPVLQDRNEGGNGKMGWVAEKVPTPDCKTIPEKEGNGKDSMRREASKRAT